MFGKENKYDQDDQIMIKSDWKKSGNIEWMTHIHGDIVLIWFQTSRNYQEQKRLC